MPEVYEAFLDLLKAGHDRIVLCDETGRSITLELCLGFRAGITRSVSPSDSRHAGDSYIVYLFLPDGVIEKKLLRVRRWGLLRLLRGKDNWSRSEFEAHEADELLSVLTAYSLRFVNA